MLLGDYGLCFTRPGQEFLCSCPGVLGVVINASALGLNLLLLCCRAVYPLWEGQRGQQCCLLCSSGNIPLKDVVCAAASLTDVTHGSQ